MLAGFVALTLLVALVGGMAAAPSVRPWYAVLPHPPASPPDWLFAPVWTVLYIVMAVAAWRVWLRGDLLIDNRRALVLWGWQLGANAVWAPVFFGLHRPGIALIAMIAMNILVALTIAAFRRIDRMAAWLLVPYLAWGIFATYLNAGFWWLNR
ncbi:tryptophan-rich sensory protein [Acidiphilium sp. AL]|uniref:Tryptophan-rich sensory protein n=1 Tax=Acidiphilium iwatense TaxID=768198 RepID=A0ABS9DZ18_9PROT|nr:MULTISPECIES: TspO/MBR family protein [Acidiphilium]MCF3946931.1 tryptophan-rich sensory protein [Acidiphilium iwatense]MCU4159764.1 tryptophan-rich sensory protein [Acidiphilium sp. AL]